MAILDQYGKPIQKEILSEVQTAQIGALRSEFASHPSRGLTPAKLARILEEAEQGNLQAQAELFDDMEEKDAHLFSEMAKRKQAILTLPWTVEAPRNASAAEKADAQWLSELLSDFNQFPELLLSLMNGVGHGYQNAEIEWVLEEREWRVKDIHPRPASWFRLAANDQNELRLRDSSAEGAALLPFGWIRHVHQAKSGYVARCGLHRVLAWPYLFKNYAIRDLAELLEIVGIPIRLGKYPAGIGDKEKATLLRAVTELGHAAAGIIPESMSIEFQSAADGSHDPHIAMNDWAERSISKAVLGGTLTSQADGKSSTNALGKIHNEVRHDLLTSDARQVAATIMRDLFYPLLALNRGQVNPHRLPKLVFDTSEKEDIKIFAESLPNLVDVGVPVTVAWVQRKLGLPVPINNEAVLSRNPNAQSTQKNQASALSALPLMTQVNSIGQENTVEVADAAWQAVLSHVERIVEASANLDDAQNRILTAYDGLPMEELKQLMTQAFTLAQLRGMLDVKAGM